MNIFHPHAAGRSPAGTRFGHVETWVFDLDNTLYPFGCSLWPQIDARITAFLAEMFGIDGLSARALQKYYYERYGTTLKGLMEEHVMTADDFLAFVHDIDRTSVEPDAGLGAAIAALPGRKLILTNGSREHAVKTTERLGIRHLFEDVFDIVAAGLVPKPEAAAYELFFEKHGVDPSRSAMFEDIARNLLVPHARGMVTVLVTEPALPAPAAKSHVDFMTSDLEMFLAGLATGLDT